MLTSDFRDLLSEFLTANVEFMVVGAFAMAAHGLPRATGDLDVWVRSTPENAEKTWSALARFGAPMQNVSRDDFSREGVVFQIGIAPRRIDVITTIDGVQFDDAWPRRMLATVDDLKLPVLSVPDLKVNKQSAGRTKDIADLEWLTKKFPD